jgi:hypothetical protein
VCRVSESKGKGGQRSAETKQRGGSASTYRLSGRGTGGAVVRGQDPSPLTSLQGMCTPHLWSQPPPFNYAICCGFHECASPVRVGRQR